MVMLAEPPGMSSFSITTTDRPSSTMRAAATRPAVPPPTTTTSASRSKCSVETGFSTGAEKASTERPESSMAWRTASLTAREVTPAPRTLGTSTLWAATMAAGMRAAA